MKHHICLVLTVFTLFLGACATPQQPIPMSPEALGPQTGKVGVVIAKLPRVDTYFPGANCLLCLATAAAFNSKLTDHVQTLSYGDLPGLKNEIADLVNKKGLQTHVIEEDADIAALPSFSATGTNIARKDFSSFHKKYEIDKLIVIETTGLGVARYYASYVPVSEPIGVFEGYAYMVNLANNQFEWFLPVFIRKNVQGEWANPPTYPVVTDAYFQALENARKMILETFADN